MGQFRGEIMKAKIKYLYLCLFVIVALVLSACSKEKDSASEIPAEVVSGLSDQAEGFLRQVYNMDDITLTQAIQSVRQQGQLNFASGLENFKKTRKEVGDLVSIESTDVSKTDSGYMVKIAYSGKDREANFTIEFDKTLSQISSFSVTPKYSLGENMKKAALNTVLGMGTVFIILIFISFLISLFKYINIFENKLKNRDTAKVLIKAEEAEEIKEESENLKDDLELVAVITAAVSEFSNTDASNLIVRSIKRVKKR